jgi:hypothetical protein
LAVAQLCAGQSTEKQVYAREGGKRAIAVFVDTLYKKQKIEERSKGKVNFVLPIFRGYTEKKLYRKCKTYIPRDETARPRSQFSHSCFCKRFIYSHNRSFYFAAENRRTVAGIYKSPTDTRMWKPGMRPSSFISWNN